MNYRQLQALQTNYQFLTSSKNRAEMDKLSLETNLRVEKARKTELTREVPQTAAASRRHEERPDAGNRAGHPEFGGCAGRDPAKVHRGLSGRAESSRAGWRLAKQRKAADPEGRGREQDGRPAGCASGEPPVATGSAGRGREHPASGIRQPGKEIWKSRTWTTQIKQAQAAIDKTGGADQRGAVGRAAIWRPAARAGDGQGEIH